MTNENPPLMNLPEQPGEYKIVQFYNDHQPYLRFGIKPGRYGDFHELILERFADEIGVKCTQIRGPDGLVSALPDSVSYRVSGAGMCKVNPRERTAIFSESSHDYEMGINQDHLQRLRTVFPEWQIS